MEAAPLLDLPVHSGRLSVEDVHAVDADVALRGVRIIRDDLAIGNESSAIVRPADLDGKRIEIWLRDDLLTNSSTCLLRSRIKKASDDGLVIENRFECWRKNTSEETNQLFADLIWVSAERELDAPAAGEVVDDKRELRSCGMFDKNGRFPFSQRSNGNFGELQCRIDFHGRAMQFPVAFEDVEEFTEGQVLSRDLTK